MCNQMGKASALVGCGRSAWRRRGGEPGGDGFASQHRAATAAAAPVRRSVHLLRPGAGARATDGVDEESASGPAWIGLKAQGKPSDWSQPGPTAAGVGGIAAAAARSDGRAERRKLG